MGTKNNPAEFDCYEKADPDEPMFILLARDAQAATSVRSWAIARLTNGEKNYSKIIEALQCADAMDEWRRQSIGV